MQGSICTVRVLLWILLCLLCSSNGCCGNSVEVKVWNTFQDIHVTEGEETIYDVDGPVPVTTDIEFINFPYHDGYNQYGFYDIDVGRNSIVLSLVDNSGADQLVNPDGIFDRFYLEFSEPVVHAMLVPLGTAIHSTVKVLPPGYPLDFVNIFHLNIPVPASLENGGIQVQIIPGGQNLTLYETVTIAYRLESHPDVTTWSTFRHAHHSQGSSNSINSDIDSPVLKTKMMKKKRNYSHNNQRNGHHNNKKTKRHRKHNNKIKKRHNKQRNHKIKSRTKEQERRSSQQ